MLSFPAFASVWNNPYPEDEANQLIYYNSFSEQPKTLDPARSYSSNEYIFTGQIYEPPLQYDYLKRPYELIPLTASAMPSVRYIDQEGRPVDSSDTGAIAYSIYTIDIKPGIYYQPHPAFARNSKGQFYYQHLTEDFFDEHDIQSPSDFKHQGRRELVADDYIYQIKRLATPSISSPIYGLMNHYILGFDDFGKILPPKKDGVFLDLRKFPLQGVKKITKYRFEITLKGQYSQFVYWLAMPFFAPIPWEVDRFYSQSPMDDENLTLDWFPVGTGPFMLSENNPNERMVLAKNPNFRNELFPENGSQTDREQGFLTNLGKRLPLIDKAIFTLEKESIPRWNKFLQGYYDSSGISADSFDQAIQINSKGEAVLTDSLKNKNIRLTQTNDASIYYMGFNMLDPIVGGKTERARKLRQAISIAVDYEEYIAIFFNGRGQAAQGPVPPGIFGYKEGQEGMNPYVYRWQDGHLKRRALSDAKKLMKQAGYPEGIDPKTQRPLILNYDVPAAGGPELKAQLGWMRKQFAKLGIALNVRATQYNRFQEKMRSGNAQIFSWGWNADYPDPENFFFLLYSPNGKVKHGGENAANYSNPEFDRLFQQMKNRPNDEKRQQLIDKMMEIVRYDAPWIWGVNTKGFILAQQWVSRVKPNTIAQNTLKYVSIDLPLRNELRKQWNQPILWPLLILLSIVFLLAALIFLAYRGRQNRLARRVKP